jgi:hypothetical protein
MVRVVDGGAGAAAWGLLFAYADRKQAACRRKHGRGILKQACHG